MTNYTVKKNTYYLDRRAYDAFQPTPMTRREAERAAYRGRGVVQVWRDGELVQEYAGAPVLAG